MTILSFQDMQNFNVWWGTKHPGLTFGQAIELWKEENNETKPR